MDTAAVGDLIAKVGFPIVAALGLGYVIWSLARWGMRTGDRLAARFESHVDKLDADHAEIKPALIRIEDRQREQLASCRAASGQFPRVFDPGRPQGAT